MDFAQAFIAFYDQNQAFCWAMLPILVIWVKAMVVFMKATAKIALVMLFTLGALGACVYAMVQMAGLA